MQRNNLKQIHPLFPSLDTNVETSQFEEQIYSDHLPIMLEKAGIKALSYNIQGFNAADNLKRMPGLEGGYENRQIIFKREKARYERVVEAIARMVEKNDMNVVGLQEASFNFELEDASENVSESYDLISSMLARLGNDKWAVSFGGADKDKEQKGIVTFYKKTELDLRDENLDTNDRVISTTFFVKKAQKTVHAYNIWGKYSDDPRPMEVTIKKYLERHLGDEAILFGDTNSRIASMSSEQMNLTTGVIPPAFNEASYDIENRELQLPDHPDGGFYIGMDGVIYQLDHLLLNPQKGEIYISEQDVDTFITGLSDEQKAVFSYPRAILSLDHNFLNKKYFPKAASIAEYEKHLQDLLKDPRLNVSYEATVLNKKGVCVRLHKPNNALLSRLAVYKILYEKKAMLSGVMKPFIHLEFDQLELFDDIVHGREPVMEESIEESDEQTILHSVPTPISDSDQFEPSDDLVHGHEPVMEESIEESAEQTILHSVPKPILVAAAVGALALGGASVMAMIFAWPVIGPSSSMVAFSSSALTGVFGGGAIAATAATVLSGTGIGMAMSALGGFVGGMIAFGAKKVSAALSYYSDRSDSEVSLDADQQSKTNKSSVTNTAALLESMPLKQVSQSAKSKEAHVGSMSSNLEHSILNSSTYRPSSPVETPEVIQVSNKPGR